MKHYKFSYPEELDRHVLTGNLMQRRLAECNGEPIEDFIRKHAAQFRAVLEGYLEYVEGFNRDVDEMLQRNQPPRPRRAGYVGRAWANSKA